jgi:hypothetical protein
MTEQLLRPVGPLGLEEAGAVLGHDPLPLESYYSQEWFELERPTGWRGPSTTCVPLRQHSQAINLDDTPQDYQFN